MDSSYSIPIIFALTFGPILLSVWALRRQLRFQRALEARRESLRESEGLTAFSDTAPIHYEQIYINHPGLARGGLVTAITPQRLIGFRRLRTLPEAFTFPHTQLRWFGRPQKYTDGDNEIWLHYETDSDWILLKLRMHRAVMQDFVRGMKTAVDPELVTAYRRRRPYRHADPLYAHPATQDIHGAWTLGNPLYLYLMPRFLVILDSETFLRKIPLDAIQEIGALKRLDEPTAQGLLCFRAEEETFAFAIDHHDAFAQALADSAKRTLEEPLIQKQKGKEYDEDEDYD